MNIVIKKKYIYIYIYIYMAQKNKLVGDGSRIQDRLTEVQRDNHSAIMVVKFLDISTQG